MAANVIIGTCFRQSVLQRTYGFPLSSGGPEWGDPRVGLLVVERLRLKLAFVMSQDICDSCVSIEL